MSSENCREDALSKQARQRIDPEEQAGINHSRENSAKSFQSRDTTAGCLGRESLNGQREPRPRRNCIRPHRNRAKGNLLNGRNSRLTPPNSPSTLAIHVPVQIERRRSFGRRDLFIYSRGNAFSDFAVRTCHDIVVSILRWSDSNRSFFVTIRLESHSCM
jgi:hypothetical protein